MRFKRNRVFHQSSGDEKTPLINDIDADLHADSIAALMYIRSKFMAHHLLGEEGQAVTDSMIRKLALRLKEMGRRGNPVSSRFIEAHLDEILDCDDPVHSISS
jgi:hypothetical protein